ncbi:hypothetical protein L249_6681 [Ophiocordyceps polyrhachis-furcata BCC 54312]|uniref:Uncharacterized protein n=1 Tax=Ophiocordyceps polyrhachis-furcata BCC 54312 TaxID=1330021 RepID=A0A367LJX7_9HYPO|nr:hypothetical protein L249_6681 [Ophiocordyceps polyrhachis-furcata BCC 54312]
MSHHHTAMYALLPKVTITRRPWPFFHAFLPTNRGNQQMYRQRILQEHISLDQMSPDACTKSHGTPTGLSAGVSESAKSPWLPGHLVGEVLPLIRRVLIMDIEYKRRLPNEGQRRIFPRTATTMMQDGRMDLDGVIMPPMR